MHPFSAALCIHSHLDMFRTIGRRIRHDSAILVGFMRNEDISMVFNGFDLSMRIGPDGTAKQLGCRRLLSGDAVHRMNYSDGGVDVTTMRGKMPFKIDDMDGMVKSVSQGEKKHAKKHGFLAA